MEIGESCTAPAPETTPVLHAAVMLKSVTFSQNHPVEQDTLGNFAPPEWLRGRVKQWPVCYTRGRKITIKARFDVLIGPFAAEDVEIRARLEIGSTALEWQGKVHVGPDDVEVETGDMESSAALPNQVACIDPAKIGFWATPPGESQTPAGSSTNVLYVLLGDPTETPPYWTLLDISCRAASGATTPVALIEQGYIPYQGLALTRMRDGQGLTYWNPDSTECTTTEQLLASGDGSGQCGSWAEFLVDMYKAHGVTGAVKVLIVRTIRDWRLEISGFLVKNWEFVGSGSHPPPFTHEMKTECVKKLGIPGQRNPNPPPGFFNHFIVKALAKFYDPSYGGGPILTQAAWEVGAIDGLFSHGYCGYPKSDNLTTLLLQFKNATTMTPL